MFDSLKSKFDLWLTNRHDHDRLSRASASAIMLGFVWRAENVGGVRGHIEAIQNYSRYEINVYPSSYTCDRLTSKTDRVKYVERCLNNPYSNCSLIHTHVHPGFMRLARAMQDRGVPWVHTYHTLYFLEDSVGELFPWQQQVNQALLNVASQADVKISVSPWLSRYLEQQYGVETIVIPNGVDVAACDRAVNASSRNERSDDAILFVGSIDEIKNPLAFIRAAEALPSLRFVMLGTGLEHASIQQHLKVSIPSNLSALGPVVHDVALMHIANCRALVMTSRREGFPTVLLEAMACRKPCVAPRSYGCADVIGDEAFGYLYTPDDDNDLVAQIKVAACHGINERARERVVEKFDWPVVIKQLDREYETLLTARSA